jgi:hypothetical protein
MNGGPNVLPPHAPIIPFLYHVLHALLTLTAADATTRDVLLGDIRVPPGRAKDPVQTGKLVASSTTEIVSRIGSGDSVVVQLWKAQL